MNLRKPGIPFIGAFTASVSLAVLALNLFLIPPKYKATTRFSRPASDRNFSMEPRLSFEKGSITSVGLMWVARSEHVLTRLNSFRKEAGKPEMSRGDFAETHSIYEHQDGAIIELAVLRRSRKEAIEDLTVWSKVFQDAVKAHARLQLEDAIAELKNSLAEAEKSESAAAAALTAMAVRDRALAGREAVSRGEIEFWRLEALAAGLDATAAGLGELSLRAQGVPGSLKGGKVRLFMTDSQTCDQSDGTGGAAMEFAFPEAGAVDPATLRSMLSVWIPLVEKQRKSMEKRQETVLSRIQVSKTDFLLDDLEAARLRRTWEAARDTLTAVQKKLAELEISRSVTPGLVIALDQPACPDGPGFPRVALNTAGAFLASLAIAVFLVMVAGQEG